MLVLMLTKIALLSVSILFAVDSFMILFELYDMKISKMKEPIIKNRRVVIISFDLIVFSIISPIKIIFESKLHPLFLLNTLIVPKFYLFVKKL